MFVGKAKRSAGSRRPVVPVAELYANGNGSGSGQGGDCDCDLDDYGSCDSNDCGQRAVEVVDVHKHGCSPGDLGIIAISIRIGKYPSQEADREIGKGAEGWRWWGRPKPVHLVHHHPLCLPPCHTEAGPWARRLAQSIIPSACDAQTHNTHNTRPLAHESARFSCSKRRLPTRTPRTAGGGGLGRMMVRVFVYPLGETEPHRGGLRV